MRSATISHRSLHSLRFVRWSRRSSATFHSLGREVTIGELDVHVVERLALKGHTATSASTQPPYAVGGREHTEEPDGAAPLTLLLAAEGLPLPTEVASAHISIASYT